MTPTHLFVAGWPVLDPPLPLHELIDEAVGELPALLERVHAVLVSRPSWAIRPGSTVPGFGGWGSVLTVEARAIASPRT